MSMSEDTEEVVIKDCVAQAGQGSSIQLVEVRSEDGNVLIYEEPDRQEVQIGQLFTQRGAKEIFLITNDGQTATFNKDDFS